MKTGFEDKFTDAQAEVIALCLEMLENSGKTADKIYVYMMQNEDEDYIDAFFEKDGKLFTTGDLFSDDMIKSFFRSGVNCLEDIIDLCAAYEAQCPCEFRLIYNVSTKAFDSSYNYENVTEVCGKDVIELCGEWFSECESNL